LKDCLLLRLEHLRADRYFVFEVFQRNESLVYRPCKVANDIKGVECRFDCTYRVAGLRRVCLMLIVRRVDVSGLERELEIGIETMAVVFMLQPRGIIRSAHAIWILRRERRE
jgi:hypothetical protein